MISKYIKELLNEHNRVIVPDLGAFLHKGESSKILYFNEFLRFNDGLLLNYISDQEKIDKIEAAKQIKAFVEETNKNLQAKKQILIENVGALYLDNNDKIQLKTEDLPANQTDEPEKETTSVPKEKSQTFESKEPDLLIIERKSDEPKQEIITPVQTKAIENTEVKEKIIPEVKPSIQNDTAAVTQQKQFSQKNNKVPPPVQNKRNNKVIWIVGIAVLVIISLLYYFIVKPLYDNKTINQNNITNPANLDTIISIPNDSVKKEVHQPVKKEPSRIPMVSSKGKKYYLVIGCFVQENNADKVILKLKSEGYNPEKFAKIEEMYFVSIASFGDKTSADNQLKSLKAKGYNDIWIKHY